MQSVEFKKVRVLDPFTDELLADMVKMMKKTDIIEKTSPVPFTNEQREAIRAITEPKMISQYYTKEHSRYENPVEETKQLLKQTGLYGHFDTHQRQSL